MITYTIEFNDNQRDTVIAFCETWVRLPYQPETLEPNRNRLVLTTDKIDTGVVLMGMLKNGSIMKYGCELPDNQEK